MSGLKKMLLTLCVALCLGSLLTACNTVKGVGQDVEAGGKALKRAAN